jgi:HK97 family phage major capsid protein
MDFNKLITELRAEFGNIQPILDEVNRQLKAKDEEITKLRGDMGAAVEELRGRLQRGETPSADAGVRRTQYGTLVPSMSQRGAEWFVRAFNKAERELNSTTGANGGYLVPPDYTPEFLKIVTAFGQFRQNARVVPMTTDEKTYPALDGGVNVYWPGENQNITETEPTFKEVKLTAKTMAALTHAPLSLVRDSNPAIGQIIAEVIARAMAAEEDRVGFRGKVASGDPFDGILNDAGVVSVTMAATKTTFATITADNLLDLTTAVPSGALAGAKFYLHRSILAYVQKLKDSTGNYIWQAPTAGAPGTVWGYGYELIETMPNAGQSAISTPFVIFGNLLYFMLGDRQGVEVAVSDAPGFKALQTHIRFHERIAIKGALPEGIAVLKTAAA